MNSKNITFIIPTNREKVYPLDSIPADCSLYIEKEGNDYQARNMGIRKAKTDIIIVCDDDIKFSKDFLDLVLSKMEKNTLVGLEDYYPMRWCITRFMCFWKEDWERIGGFDEEKRGYGGPDTDFCIKMEKAGVKIIQLPRDSVEHIYPEKKRPAMDELRNLLYLMRRHPRQILIPAFKLIFRKITKIEL
jgi:GT2 family glycosyltransferase